MKLFKNNWQLLLIILLSLSISWPVFLPGYFYHHDDLQVMRVFEMRKCLEDFQIPCRWVPDMGYGNGFPLFNYYGVLPYYIGGILSFIFGFVGAAKTLFLIPIVLGGISMYFLGKELFGKNGALAVSVLYLFAPYRALDIYVRGAIAESFAMSLVPFTFYFSLRLIRQNNAKNLLGFSSSLGLFLMCHNIMTMFFIPVLILWISYFLLKESIKNLRGVLIGFLLGVGLGAFFVFPAILEKNLVQTETLLRGGTDFRAHFVSISQLFLDRSWGYGGSVFGPNDSISFQIGWPLWWIVVIVLGFVFIKARNKDFKENGIIGMTGLLTIIFGGSIFLMHNKSTFLWEALNPLQYAQFPWRLLTLTIFSGSIFGGILVYCTAEKYQKFLLIIILVLSIGLNWQFFKPRDFYPWVNDSHKLSDPLWEIQQKAGIMDYLPVTAYEPFARADDKPVVRAGQAEIENYKVRSNWFTFNALISENSQIEVPVFDFPGWKTYSDGKEIIHSHQNHLGRIRLDLHPGNFMITGRFEDSPIRSVSNLISLISFGILVLIWYKKKQQWI